MRQFLIMGFNSHRSNDPGEVLGVVGTNQAAVDAVNDPSGGYVRKELFELAVPRQRRTFEKVEGRSEKAEGKKGKK